jgi:hypothetical protein
MALKLLVGTRKGLFMLEDGLGGWAITRHDFIGTPVTSLLHDARSGMYYAALNHGHFGVKLHRSDDGGAIWEELAPPAFPEGLGGEADKAPSVSLIWSLAAGGADRRGQLWAGTIPGALFRSDDRGSSWSLVENLWQQESRARWFGGGYDDPGIHSILIDPRDSNRMVLGISCGGVWLSRDGGTSWTLGGKGMVATYMPPEARFDEAVQDPHRIVACPAAPDRLWAQHHNGVFRSEDGGANWSQIAGLPLSDFGFAVAVHPTKPDTAWFVPAESDEKRIPLDGQFVVTRTRDGGHHFDTLRAGLPQPPAYDLVYRHALDVAPDGQTLAMGSSTGSLWTSANSGDAWQLANGHLPPIACVSFAA